MKYLHIALLLCITHISIAQRWHKSTDTLRSPVDTTGYYPTVVYFNGYDTVKVLYYDWGEPIMYVGYKAVYIKGDHYIDDSTTVGVMFDEHMRRMNGLKRYTFTSAPKPPTIHWHYTKDALRPINTAGDYKSNQGWFNRYDSMPVMYALYKDTTLYKGYKYVHVQKGQYVDTEVTIGVILDTHFRVVPNVEKYYFTEH